MISGESPRESPAWQRNAGKREILEKNEFAVIADFSKRILFQRDNFITKTYLDGLSLLIVESFIFNMEAVIWMLAAGTPFGDDVQGCLIYG